MGTVEVGSVFARLQAAVMGGAELREIHKIATSAFAALLSAGAYNLVSASRQPLGQRTEFEPKEWRTWEVESRTNFSSREASQVVRFVTFLDIWVLSLLTTGTFLGIAYS